MTPIVAAGKFPREKSGNSILEMILVGFDARKWCAARDYPGGV
jgi:hypothetical protein